MSPMEKGNDKNSEAKCCLWNSEGKLAGLAEGPIAGISVWKSCFHSGKSFRCYRVLVQGRDSIKLVPTVSLLPSPTKAKTVMLGNISSNLSWKMSRTSSASGPRHFSSSKLRRNCTTRSMVLNLRTATSYASLKSAVSEGHRYPPRWRTQMQFRSPPISW
jgi:hypothetical protein